MGSLSQESKYHVILFPFMAKGHTIPLLHLARLLLRRSIAVTIFTTPANRSFIAKSLFQTAASIIDLPFFPQNYDPQIPSGIESTDQLPSMSLFPSFALSTKLMQSEFEHAIGNLPFINFMVSDGFLWWTLESARKFGFSRFVFFGMSNHAMCMIKVVNENKLFLGPELNDELISLPPPFSWLQVTKSDFDPFFYDPEPKGLDFEFVMLASKAASNSNGYIMNSFFELERVFIEYWNNNGEPIAWCIGPLCLVEPTKDMEHELDKKPTWIQWLDKKLEQEKPVLYVAFGTQAEISLEQIKEIAIGLEESKIDFLWVMRDNKIAKLIEDNGFEDRVKGRGIIVKEWVNQREILKHMSVKGFLSHCGWNSVLESICEGVPILAWPMMAEQPSNARMVVEVIKVGVRVETCDGSVRGFVKWEGLVKMMRELMEGEMGKKVRKKVKEVAEMAKKAMEDKSGSSILTLDLLIHKTCNGENS